MLHIDNQVILVICLILIHLQEITMDLYMEQMKERGVRVELDARHEPIQKKVRDAQIAKIPLMVTIGEKEVEKKTLAVRTADGQVQFGVQTQEFIRNTQKEIAERTRSS